MGGRGTNHARHLLQLLEDAAHEPAGGGLAGAAGDANHRHAVRGVIKECRRYSAHRLSQRAMESVSAVCSQSAHRAHSATRQNHFSSFTGCTVNGTGGVNGPPLCRARRMRRCGRTLGVQQRYLCIPLGYRLRHDGCGALKEPLTSDQPLGSACFPLKRMQSSKCDHENRVIQEGGGTCLLSRT